MTFVCGKWGFGTFSEDYTNPDSSGNTYTLITYNTNNNGDKINRVESAVAIGPGDTLSLWVDVANGLTGTIRLWRREYAPDGTFTGVKVVDVTSDLVFCPLGPK